MSKAARLAVFSCIATCVLTAIAQAQDAAPRFELPVACVLGTECLVQNYLDHEPGPGARDQTCGPLSYDGHRGIDIRVPGMRHMRAGVVVLAAAPGTVIRVRDGEPDISLRERGADAVLGREAGNGVVIDHGDGWESQYSHLRRGSVAVSPGDRVEAGTPLGLIGLSGKTEFPHLHFEVRHQGQTLDPFTGWAPEKGCGQAGTPLWSEAAATALAYRAGGLLDAGFAAGPLGIAEALGETPPTAPGRASPALVFWAAAWGLRAGDREVMRLIGPDGAPVADWSGTRDKDQAQSLRYTGRKRRGEAWPPGTYRGTYRVRRVVDGAERIIVETQSEVELR